MEVILKDVGLSEEKFKRLVSLLRRIGIISGGFRQEWSMGRIKREIRASGEFAEIISELLVDGKRDPRLQGLIPKYYLEKLNFREIRINTQERRRIQYKASLIGTYGGRKGKRVEQRIQESLDGIKQDYGIDYAKGATEIIDTTADFAIPSLTDPHVIIMVSFQETTSSGQSTKARDMLAAYQALQRWNSRTRENRAFVNFVDGGGWLARRNDFERLVNNCDYFVNFEYLELLESIITYHVPRSYFSLAVD